MNAVTTEDQMPHIMQTDRFVVREWPSGPGATLSSRLREPWPAIVELEGSPRRLRLRIMEDACSYIVRAEVDDAPSEAFDAELDGNRVRIVVRDDSDPEDRGVGGRS